MTNAHLAAALARSSILAVLDQGNPADILALAAAADAIRTRPVLYAGSVPGRLAGRFVATGEYRPPTAGEYFISGAIPEVYEARHPLTTAYHLARPATPEETRCPLCDTERRIAR